MRVVGLHQHEEVSPVHFSSLHFVHVVNICTVSRVFVFVCLCLERCIPRSSSCEVRHRPRGPSSNCDVVYFDRSHERSVLSESSLIRHLEVVGVKCIPGGAYVTFVCIIALQRMVIQHASAVAQGNVVRAMSASYGKSLYSTPSQKPYPLSYNHKNLHD
jgi:hypothetical protein